MNAFSLPVACAIVLALLPSASCGGGGELSSPAAPSLAPVATATFEARSKGYVDVYSQGYAQILKDGQVLYAAGGGAGGGRGFNVAAFDTSTGVLLQPVRNFDTWGTAYSGEAANALAAHLAALPTGALVVIAVGDDAGLSMQSSANQRVVAALEALGSREIRALGFRGAWCMVAIKGDARVLDERRTSGAEAVATATITLR
jgi:hypothetical protein